MVALVLSRATAARAAAALGAAALLGAFGHAQVATLASEPALESTRPEPFALGAGLRLYGFVRLDAMYDDSRMNDVLIPVYARSEDPSPPGGVPAGVVAEEDDDEFAMSTRLTRLGLDFDGPTLPDAGDAKLGGKLEIDFYNVGLDDSDSRAAIRMRLAYLTLSWGSWTLLAGQDWDVISPLYPVANNDIVHWGSGNLGDRRPQVTLANTTGAGAGRIVSEVGFALSGAVSSSSVVGGLRSGENSGRPMLHGRVGYHGETDAGAPYQFGVWGHDSEFEFDATGAGEETFDSWSVGIDARVPLVGDRLWAKCELWRGENLADVRGGILQGVNATTGEEITAQGGFLELGWQASEELALHAGFSRDDPDDADLDPFDRARNTAPYLAARWKRGALSYGVEVLHWKTEYVGLADGDALRVLGFLAYSF